MSSSHRLPIFGLSQLEACGTYSKAVLSAVHFITCFGRASTASHISFGVSLSHITLAFALHVFLGYSFQKSESKSGTTSPFFVRLLTPFLASAPSRLPASSLRNPSSDFGGDLAARRSLLASSYDSWYRTAPTHHLPLVQATFAHLHLFDNLHSDTIFDHNHILTISVSVCVRHMPRLKNLVVSLLPQIGQLVALLTTIHFRVPSVEVGSQ